MYVYTVSTYVYAYYMSVKKLADGLEKVKQHGSGQALQYFIVDKVFNIHAIFAFAMHGHY